MQAAVQAELNMLKDIIVKTVPVEQILLFGSYAYGTPHKDSDLDLYVVLKDDAGIRDIDASIEIYGAISEKKTMPVDIVVTKQHRYLARKNSATIEHEIADKGIVLYG
ncbi:hypothetical protein AGMMS49546_30080 [Spirochaetia bacterium]|nr:hypothetical protein AGMMS49546_30080 [Spirochaetia bacterium]